MKIIFQIFLLLSLLCLHLTVKSEVVKLDCDIDLVIIENETNKETNKHSVILTINDNVEPKFITLTSSSVDFPSVFVPKNDEFTTNLSDNLKWDVRRKFKPKNQEINIRYNIDRNTGNISYSLTHVDKVKKYLYEESGIGTCEKINQNARKF